MSGNNEQHLDIDPCDIEETEAQKIAAMEAQYKKTFDDMNAKIALLELEKQAAVAIGVKALAQVAEAGAPAAVAPGSGKKPNYTADHPDRHNAVVLVTAPALLALKQLQNNHDAIWWCAKHIEALGVGDKPNWHKSYKDWASDYKNEALDKYIPFVEGTPAAGSP
jgi:hypothetical protein